MNSSASNNWLTRAELSGFQETSRYEEAIEYCKRLAAASEWIKYTTFGQSGRGRDLPLLIASKTKDFTPDAARRKGPILLIINGIHSGEIAGKEASFMLLRDMVITKQKASLLENLTLLIVPIYNVDGHERVSPYNRINQIGPREMGWRATAQNLNLNRDWIKADQLETRAMLKLFAEWYPDMLIDNHVSDGADFQYNVTFIANDHLPMPEPVIRYFQDLFEPELQDWLSGCGHVVARYFELADETDPAAGIKSIPYPPRFSSGYSSLHNRPTMVVETHSLKSYENRIHAHYDLMEGSLRSISRNPTALRKAVHDADQETRSMSDRKVPVRVRLSHEHEEDFPFKGVEYTREQSRISGTTMVTYGKKPITLTVPYYQTVVEDLSVTAPLGYLIPPEWTQVIERLEFHSIEFSRLKQAVRSQFETYRFTDVSWDAAPFEGRHQVQLKTQKVMEERILPEGSILVRMNQRTNRVILTLLEPDSDDSLISWGFFDSIFEQKEDAENYILEKLAAEMLEKDKNLKKEFEDRLKSDKGFASNARARLQFFYQRSPFWDQQKDAYPVVRVTSESQMQ
jgi:hypothetical protein